jgi:NADH-quinone oxidoreductase subunit M
MLAYSSINHLGYCLLAACVLAPGGAGAGWVNGTAPALNGVILQMLNHGLTAAALFRMRGACWRAGGGGADPGPLRRAAAGGAGLFAADGHQLFASVGLPGLNGFVGNS